MSCESIGLTATLFVLLSFIMKKPELIRAVNSVGAFLFVVYGVMINSVSTWLLNGMLIGIHVFYLLKEYLEKNR